MMAIGSYFAFIIFMMGTITAVHISDEERNQYFQDILTEHNIIRNKHYAEPLNLDQEICDLIKVHTDKLEANEETEIPTNYGINLFSIRFEEKPNLNAKWPVYFWSKKSTSYNYRNEPQAPSKEIDAFTQLVWKDTTDIGVGMWIVDNIFYVVVAYSPPGNITNQYLTNVLRPRPIIKTNN